MTNDADATCLRQFDDTRPIVAPLTMRDLHMLSVRRFSQMIYVAIASALVCSPDAVAADGLVNTYANGDIAVCVSSVFFDTPQEYGGNNLINGSGFVGVPSKWQDHNKDGFPEHANNASGETWIGQNNQNAINTEWVSFSFDQSHRLGTMRLWNFNQQGTGNQEHGVKTAYLWYSNDATRPPASGSTDGASPGRGWTKLVGPGANGIWVFNKAPGTYDGVHGTSYNGKSYHLDGIQARHVLIDVESNHYSGPKANFVGLSEVQFVDASRADPPGLARGHRILIDRGLQLLAGSVPMAAGHSFDAAVWSDSNFTTVNIWHDHARPGLIANGCVPNEAGTPWSTDVYHTTVWEPGVKRYPLNLKEADYRTVDYASSLVGIQFGDEQGIRASESQDELDRLKSAMAAWHVNHPKVLTYTNQQGGQIEAAAIQEYMRQVQPDILHFDTYAFTTEMVTGSPTGFYQDIEKYRKLALAGNDGTGDHPIPVGLYTLTSAHSYNGYHVVSESEIRLNNFAAFAFGCKVLDSFVYDHPPIDPKHPEHPHPVEPVLFDAEGKPTAQFHQKAETNRQSRNLGSSLLRLISTDARMIMGQHLKDNIPVDNLHPDGMSRWNIGAGGSPYITSITVTNLGKEHGGLRGDVIIGYFQPLHASFTNVGRAYDTYFMIVNALNSQTGSARDCLQRIRLDFDFGGSGIHSLVRRGRDTGDIEDVSLTHISGSLYYVILDLEGGTADLFKFDNGGTFVRKTSLPD